MNIHVYPHKIIAGLIMPYYIRLASWGRASKRVLVGPG
jgi:hypothetical protein